MIFNLECNKKKAATTTNRTHNYRSGHSAPSNCLSTVVVHTKKAGSISSRLQYITRKEKD